MPSRSTAATATPASTTSSSRDNRLNPNHEGTHGVHGLDLLGRKVVMDGGAGLRLLIETISLTTARRRPRTTRSPASDGSWTPPSPASAP
ncbi:hypothetical protein [Streptomyces sp. NPDC005209]|uniref:hypothetical protein n=1 Tax=Streptomyces sp. NPDC005209 TaxID=3156715 RepID=UPI0033AECC8A